MHDTHTLIRSRFDSTGEDSFDLQQIKSGTVEERDK